MITEILLTIIITPTKLLLDILPNIPLPPEPFINAAEQIMFYTYNVNNFFRWLFGDIIWSTVIFWVPTMLILRNSKSLLNFVLRKIPMLNIR